MKQMICEMCGSTDLVKQDGLFVCQHCGCKYSVEEARKMMIDGTVDVSGSTVKVDSSGELANLYQIARRSKDDNNAENAMRYYDMIMVKDPTSWEASFYIVYFRAAKCKIAEIRSSAISVANCQDSVLSLIRDHVSANEQAAAVQEVITRSVLMANMLTTGAGKHYDEISPSIRGQYHQEFCDNICAARDILYTCGTQIDRIFYSKKDIAKYAADAWKAGIELHKKYLPHFANVEANKKTISLYADKIGKYDPNYLRKYQVNEKKAMHADQINKLNQEKNKSNHYLGYFLGVICVAYGLILYPVANEGIIGIGLLFFIVPGIALFIWGMHGTKRIKEINVQIEAIETEIDKLGE